MMKVLRLALITLMLSAVGACALVQRDESRTSCSGEFDLNGLKEPLGSSTALYAQMQRAVRDKNPVQLADLTRAVGWTDDWDLMADVGAGTKEAELNGFTQTPGYCWKGLPAVRYPVPEGFYLFFRNRVPVQKVAWRGDSMPMELRTGVSLTPQTPLVVQWAKLGPAA